MGGGGVGVGGGCCLVLHLREGGEGGGGKYGKVVDSAPLLFHGKQHLRLQNRPCNMKTMN